MRKSTFLFAFLLLIIPCTAKAETASTQVTQTEQSTQNDDKILQLYKAAELRDANAMFKLGEIYRYGAGVPWDNIAMKWYLKAAQSGHAGAMYELGEIYLYGLGVPEDTNKAAEWYGKVIEAYRKDAETGNSDAMFKLGEIYSYGWAGVAEDKNIAVEWYLKAAQSGHARAMYKLGEIYRYGLGVPEDTNKAVKWYGKAIEAYRKDAETGNSDAMFKLGEIYSYGKAGVAEDKNIAFEWYHISAQSGHARAMSRLGFLYSAGWGVPKDTNEAVKWYGKAIQAYRKDAKPGNRFAMSEAMFELGEMYYFGKRMGVNQDYAKSLEWFLKAAEAGNSIAMCKIGLMYENGKGVTKDYEQAEVWYEKAINLRDNDEAKERLIFIFVKKYYKIGLLGFLAVFILGGFIFAYEKEPEDKDAKVLEIDGQPKDRSIWMTARRYMGALIIYLIYWLTLWGTITRVVGTTSLDYQFIKSFGYYETNVADDVIFPIWDCGWGDGDHYIWFLIIFCFVTFCCATLAGATAKRKGAIVASIANLPVIVFLSFYCIFLYTLQIEVESPVAWKIVLPLSIMGSIYFSILGGTAGQKSQSENFADNTIFGIRSFHWFWLWLASIIYINSFASRLVKVIFGDFTSGYGLISSLAHLVLILPVFIIYGYAVFFMYEILSGGRLGRKNVIVKIFAFIGCYIGGLIAGAALERIIYKIFGFVPNLFS